MWIRGRFFRSIPNSALSESPGSHYFASSFRLSFRISDREEQACRERSGALSLLATPVVAVQAAATSDPSEALASYLFQHAADSDKQVLIQWAYVALSKTSAARQVQTIPSSKVKSVESNAQKTLTNLVVGRCSAPALRVFMKNPKNGLQETMTLLATKLVNAEIERRTSPLLSLTISDLIGSKK